MPEDDRLVVFDGDFELPVVSLYLHVEEAVLEIAVFLNSGEVHLGP